MNTDILEKVLSCDRLPSLPAVAVRVIELTQNQDVSFKDLAETIHNDQALAAKVIRTVNSSFFGLRQRCSSINQAIVLLGLSAVKTLALGFSLVSAINGTSRGEDGAEGSFDYVSYWRRSLFTGIAARTIAKHGAKGGEEECFLGGLLQDVGMVALHQALGADYADVLREAGSDHRRLAEIEIGRLDTQHADIGAMLASRWKLPEDLVMPIKYHERPSAAPPKCLAIVRAVALGNIAADVLTTAEPAGPLSRYYTKSKEWFGLDETSADEILRSISGSTREVARLLQINAGDIADADEILEQAHERLLAMTIPAPASAGSAGAAGAGQDATGLPTRAEFERTLIAAFAQAAGARTPITLALLDIDGLDAINRSHSRATGDAVLAAMGAGLKRELAPTGGHAFSLGGGRIAVLMLRADRIAATRTVESVRRHFNASPVATPKGPVAATASVGMTWVDAGVISRFADPGDLLDASERALAAAKGAGRNTLRLYTPAAAAA